MKTKKIVLAAIAAAGLIALNGCSDNSEPAADQQKAQTTVGIVQLVEHPALDEANRGIVEAVQARGLKVAFDQQNAQADQSNLGNIAQRFVSQKYPLIFAIATPAAQIMANATNQTPIVATAVTDFEVAKLVKSNDKPGTNAQQVALMLELFPDANRIGTIYNSSEINSQFQAKILKEEVQQRGLSLVELTVSSVNDVQQTAQSMIGKVDVIYVPTDNIIASAMPVLTKITTPARIGVITGEEGMLKGGGLATVGVDYYNLGRIAGDMGADILEGKSKPQDMAIRYQTEFKSKINAATAEKLGIKIPDSLAKNAELVRY